MILLTLLFAEAAMVGVADVDEKKCQEFGCTYHDDEHPEAWIG